MLLDDRVDDVLSGIVAQRGKVISDVGDVVTTGVVGFSGVHRVVGPVES